MFHAESGEALDMVNKNRPELNFRSYSSFLFTRPPSAEEEAIQTVVSLANATGTQKKNPN